MWAEEHHPSGHSFYADLSRLCKRRGKGVPIHVVTYGSESWTLTMEEERVLAVFERKILRKIYGPVKENELWRIQRNYELEDIIKGENIVRFIKSQRIRWLGHVERMQDTEIPKKMLYGKLYATRRRGRPKNEMAG
jgi:asparagine synthetase A